MNYAELISSKNPEKKANSRIAEYQTLLITNQKIYQGIMSIQSDYIIFRENFQPNEQKYRETFYALNSEMRNFEEIVIKAKNLVIPIKEITKTEKKTYLHQWRAL